MGPVGPVRRVSPVVVYTSSRVAIFVVCMMILWLLGMKSLLLVAVAFLLSGLASFVLLSRQRDAMSSDVVERAARMKRRFNERLTAEDEVDEDGNEPGRSEPDKPAG
jgi:Protein of unknown function (DUF4229)